MQKVYDLAIIGSGPAGYVAGLYASRHKLNVCVIEKGPLGGACLNRGCIPTKAMLKSASILSAIKDAPLHGIETGGYKINFQKILARRDEVVLRLRTGIETLFRANKVDLIKGAATLTGPDTIRIDGAAEVTAKNIIIAAGSKAAGLADVEIDERGILSSDGILKMEELPKSVVIIGGGVIGCEFASLFKAFDVKVSVVELMDRIVPTQSGEVSKKLELIFKKRGIALFTSSKVQAIAKAEKGALNIKISQAQTIEAERVLVAVGRVPATEGLGLEDLDIKTENAGRIIVDAHLRTNIDNIYAIGDCVGGPLLAHKASYDGMLACDNILGKSRVADYSNIPNCIWTEPEIASVGLSEEEARAKYPDARIAKFPYLASGKAYLEGKAEGFIKIIGDSDANILGVEIFGEDACNLIGEACLAKSAGVNIKDWAYVVHGHPTLAEIFQEAAHVFCGTGIHGV